MEITHYKCPNINIIMLFTECIAYNALNWYSIDDDIIQAINRAMTRYIKTSVFSISHGKYTNAVLNVELNIWIPYNIF